MPLYVKETSSKGDICEYPLNDLEYSFITDSNQEVQLTLVSNPKLGGEIETREGKKIYLPTLMENSDHLLNAIEFRFFNKKVEIHSFAKDTKI